MPSSDGKDPSSSSPRRGNLVHIPDTPLDASPQTAYNYRSVSRHDPVICIDNGEESFRFLLIPSGSHSWRAGFSTMSTPYIDRLNVLSRYKERKQGRNILLFGRDTEADANARSNARQMFDGDMLIHGDLLVGSADLTDISRQA